MLISRIWRQILTNNTISSFKKKSAVTTESGLIASYERAQIISKTGSAHTVVENIIWPSFEILMKTVLHQDSGNVLKALPLSNDLIWRRIDKMSFDIENQLVDKLKNNKFSLQIDESTISNNKAILMAYIRFIDDVC